MILRQAAHKTKKGQSALEFLTTYGWAFLVILIMIGALSYFGVLDPSRFLPDKCLFGVGIGACQEVVAGSTSVGFKIVNNLGAPVTINGVTTQVTGATSCAAPTVAGGYGINSGAGAALTGIGSWNTSTSLFVNVTCATINLGERPTIRMTITYTPVGFTYAKAVDGEISVKRTS